MKLFGQYSQATTAANIRSFNPVKTMDYLLDKVEINKKKLTKGTCEDEGPVLPGQPVGAGQVQQDEVEITFNNQVNSASNRVSEFVRLNLSCSPPTWTCPVKT